MHQNNRPQVWLPGIVLPLSESAITSTRNHSEALLQSRCTELMAWKAAFVHSLMAHSVACGMLSPSSPTSRFNLEAALSNCMSFAMLLW